jgi:hypothetical protein
VLVPLALGWFLGALPVLVSTEEEEPSPGASFVVQLVSTADPVPCPEAARVAEALTARMPNVLAAGQIPAGTTVLGLMLAQGGPNAVRLQLRDRTGATVLERILDTTSTGAVGAPAHAAAAAADCAALADTVALIVERYLRQIGYRGVAPPPTTDRLAPPPDSTPHTEAVPPTDAAARAAAPLPVLGAVASTSQPSRLPGWTTTRGFLGAGIELSAPISGAGADSRWIRSVDVDGDLHLGALALSASVGVGEATEKSPVPPTAEGSFRILPMPIRLRVGLVIRAGPGTVVPQVGGGVDWLWTSTRRIDGQHPRAAVEPIIDAGAAYFLPLGRHVYFKLHAASALNLQPHDFFVLDDNSAPTIFRTARLYLRAGVDAGIALGQN